MSISAETLCIEAISYVKLSVEYIPSEVIYKFKKKNLFSNQLLPH